MASPYLIIPYTLIIFIAQAIAMKANVVYALFFPTLWFYAAVEAKRRVLATQYGVALKI